MKLFRQLSFLRNNVVEEERGMKIIILPPLRGEGPLWWLPPRG